MSRAAIRYAKAILDTAGDNAAAVNADMASIVAALNESSELTAFLADPVAT
ncbi:MAG: F0F1 ATP synthase subunit delta, partial [Chryseobacterium sp.]